MSDVRVECRGCRWGISSLDVSEEELAVLWSVLWPKPTDDERGIERLLGILGGKHEVKHGGRHRTALVQTVTIDPSRGKTEGDSE